MPDLQIPLIEIGISGTRNGMTELQSHALMFFLRAKWLGAKFVKWHHGLCAGVDVQSHALIREHYPTVKLVGHPPVGADWVDVACDEIREPKGHFARNRTIVDDTSEMVILPWQMARQTTGGTWYTHDYAIKKNKPVTIIWPGGAKSDSVKAAIHPF